MNNFNLRGALENSLSLYKAKKRLPEGMGNTKTLVILMKNQSFQECLPEAVERYQAREEDINSCAEGLYHELSKHAHTRHGNLSDLVINSTEYTISEVAAMETVFCALKKEGCFHIPLTIKANGEDRTLE